MDQEIEFDCIRSEEYFDEYETKKKLKSGLTVYVAFQESMRKDYKHLSYNIYLHIYRKKKELHNDNLTVVDPTFKAGLEGLLFARNAIIAFEKYILNKYDDQVDRIRLSSFWGNSRRREIYLRYLGRMGFKIEYFRGRKELVKYVK